MLIQFIQSDFEGRVTEGLSKDDAVCRAAKRILKWDEAVRTWNRLYDPTIDHDEIYAIEGYTINEEEYTGEFYATAQDYIRTLIKQGKFKSATANLTSLDSSLKYFYSEKFFLEQAPKKPSKQVFKPQETKD